MHMTTQERQLPDMSRGQTEGGPGGLTADRPWTNLVNRTNPNRTLAKGGDLDEGKKKVYEAVRLESDALQFPPLILHPGDKPQGSEALTKGQWLDEGQGAWAWTNTLSRIHAVVDLWAAPLRLPLMRLNIKTSSVGIAYTSLQISQAARLCKSDEAAAVCQGCEASALGVETKDSATGLKGRQQEQARK